jgi:hypothetical protein
MESLVDRRYRLALFESCLKSPAFTGTPATPQWNLECPLCGAAGALLVWLPARNTYKFVCTTKNSRSCGVQVEFPILLKRWNLPLYRQYLQEREEEGTAGSGFNVPRASEVMPQRRSRRHLEWHKSQVPPEPNTSGFGSPGGTSEDL